MADAEKGKTREEEEYVPADYVALVDSGSRLAVLKAVLG